VIFESGDKGKRQAYIAVHKIDWAEVKLARAVRPTAGPPVASTFTLPESKHEVVEINMRNVRVIRLRHGRGMMKFRDDRGYFSGHFKQGGRQGPGVEINARGKFTGTFAREFRRGAGV